MIKKITLFALLGAFLTSCVSSKIHNELESKYAKLKRENHLLNDEYVLLKKNSESDKSVLEKLDTELKNINTEKNILQKKHNEIVANYEKLKQSYDALGENSVATITANSQKNRELLIKLENKEKALIEERNRLEKLQKDLNSRSERINELESLIIAKDAKMQTLKTAISNALHNFEGKGLTIEERSGKIYISMENKLLFNSGSWTIGTKGNQAVKQLGDVLANNTDIDVLIEGHTDNVPYTGNGQLSGNWDLSTKRATSIVNLLLENQKINPKNMTAAGKSEFVPVASNDTENGKAKNRRIEVILTPKLDEISKLLNDM